MSGIHDRGSGSVNTQTIGYKFIPPTNPSSHGMLLVGAELLLLSFLSIAEAQRGGLTCPGVPASSWWILDHEAWSLGSRA